MRSFFKSRSPSNNKNAQPVMLNITTPETASEISDDDAPRLPDGSLIDEDDLAEPTSPRRAELAGTTESLLSLYRRPLDTDKAAALCPAGEGGIIWHAQLLRAGEDPEEPSSLRRKFVMEDGSAKPRRAELPVNAADFLGSLVQTSDGRFIFSGVLNGWPALTCLELRSLTLLPQAKKNRTSVFGIKRIWDAADRAGGKTPAFPSIPDEPGSVRATLRAAPWTASGYGAAAKGFVWWFMAQRPTPRLAYGEHIVRVLDEDATGGGCGGNPPVVAVQVHLFSHRYARAKKETAKDRLTYHAAILVEWSHGQHTTVIELATLHGIGGRHGRSNWYEDKMSERPSLYAHLPPEMVAPWKGAFAEIRCSDVPAKTLDEFKDYVRKHEGPQGRFVDPHFVHSGPVRLYHRTQQDVARYLINYMGRDRRYTEKVRNCQAFAADFYAFTAGKKGIEVFSAFLQPLYVSRTHLFLYDPEMYDNPTVS